jgi:alpha-L-rhamnosidase
METKLENTIQRILGLLLALAVSFLCLANAALPLSAEESSSTTISNLRVQSAEIPLAVEDKNPVFSWQMISATIGQRQSAYRIVVTKESDKSVVWDSGKADSDLSNEIRYNGSPLESDTAYGWKLTVWDANGKTYNKTCRFETGLMNPKIEAWDGAKWIGTNQLTLDAASACLFEIKTDFQIKKGSKAVSLIFGANDFRFNDSFQNIENVKGENYIRFELDVSGVGTAKGAALNIYREGYGINESPTTPYKVVSVEKYPDTNINEFITTANINDVHNMDIIVNTGEITFKIDGKTLILTKSSGGRRGFGPSGGDEGGAPDEGFEPLEGGFGPPGRGGASLSISNYSTGNNFNTYPNLNSIGFASNPGDEVAFGNYEILNVGQSSLNNNIVFDNKTGSTYSIFKILPGITVNEAGDTITVKNDTNKTLIGYVDPSYGSITMLRTIFSTKSGKIIASAKMYATAMGAYEMYINGRRMGKDWFAPGDSQFRKTLCYHAYDVTDMIIKGSNSIGAILNSGWYTGYMTFSPDNFNFFGDTEALLAKLVITYADGAKDIIVSGPDAWKLYNNGPIEYGSFFQGERYNAKKNANISVKGNLSGWSTAEYNDSQWSKAEIVKQRDWVNFDLMARYDQPVRIAQVIQAQKVLDTHSEDGHTYIYDMGVNMVGVPAVTIPAGWLRDGDVVIMRYGEQVYPGFPGDS